MGLYEAFNPYQIWLMMVLICALVSQATLLYVLSVIAMAPCYWRTRWISFQHGYNNGFARRSEENINLAACGSCDLALPISPYFFHPAQADQCSTFSYRHTDAAASPR